jgi:hypothetical protein
MSMTDLAERKYVDADIPAAATNVVKDQPQLAPPSALPAQAKPPTDVPQELSNAEQESPVTGRRRLFKNRFRHRRETIDYRLPDGAGMLGRNDFDPLVGRRI